MHGSLAAGLALGALAIAGLAMPATASADEIECASEKGRRTECAMNTRGEVRIVRQLSRAPCTEGQTWGMSRHGIWVEGGCRAVFASEGYGGGGSGYGGNAPAYGGGAAAYGGGEAPTVVTCASNGGQRTECEMDTRGEVRILRQQSKAPCIDGQTWGLNRHSVWVSGGCRATFQNVSRADQGGYDQRGGYDAPTPQQIGACRARTGGYAQVVRQEALKPGAWSIVLRNDDGEFSCDVDRNGRVEGFEQISR